MTNKPSWTANQAREFYNIPVWGEGYFDVNEAGHLIASITKDQSIDLVAVKKLVLELGLSLPVLIRFPQILHARIKQIGDAFTQALHAHNNTLRHTALYPIKVNQQRTVVENILNNPHYPVGLEVGSKTELLAAFGFLDHQHGLLVCNGYKDRAYIRMALNAQRMGLKVFIVIENLFELDIIHAESVELNVTPMLGVRVRLNSIAAGNWQNSGGRDAKFGLSSHDLLNFIQHLQEFGWQSHVKMMHFHMGSQISRLEDFSIGLDEAMHIYGEIYKHGFMLEYLDVGGGLAVDYAAQKNNGYFSKTYSVEDYAQLIVTKVVYYCRKEDLPMPHIFTENGRALTAHHAFLMTNVIEFERDQAWEFQHENIADWHADLQAMAEKILRENFNHQTEIIAQLNTFNLHACKLFNQGELNLQKRAETDQFVQYIYASLSLQEDYHLPQEHRPHGKCYCNFSVFQSMPDVWGLGQVFPILPLDNLREEPNIDARLHDLTCDSDGQISSYAGQSDTANVLRMYKTENIKDLVLGFFLLGAYQEVLGDIHNLFGDTHTINVEIDENNQIILSEVETGDCAHELLATVHISEQQIVNRCGDNLQLAKVSQSIRDEIMLEIQNALYSYTYLDSADRKSHQIKGK
jgi:arginine decarboxylase